MAKLFYNRILLLLLLITTRVGFTLGSCLPDTVGTCGCCKNSTAQCIIIPSSVIPSFPSYEKYICVSKISAANFSLNECSCTSKEPALCICSNQYSKVYPVYPSCYSFTECIMNDITVKAKQKIRGNNDSPWNLFFYYILSFLQTEFVKRLSVSQDVVQKIMLEDFIMIGIVIVVNHSFTADVQSTVLHL
jgi:hypothetical protein